MPADASLDTPPDLAPDVPEAGPPDVPDAGANDDGMDEPGDVARRPTRTPDGQDGPTGDATPPVIDIVTAGLPDALYNIAYVAQLAATGGGGTDYLWRVSSGRLPVGVDYGAGKLAGVPRESGPFVFEVTVSDRVGGSGKRWLTLNIVRKHWLAFRSIRTATTTRCSAFTPSTYGVQPSS